MRSRLHARGAFVPTFLAAFAFPAATHVQQPGGPRPPPPFQFRVNQTHSSTWSGGLDMASVAVKPDGSLSFAWVALTNEIDAPQCPNLLVDCDGFDIAPEMGESQVDPSAVVFARDFDKYGKPRELVDTGIDPVLACIGNRSFPSLAARRRNHAARGIVAAWDFRSSLRATLSAAILAR